MQLIKTFTQHYAPTLLAVSAILLGIASHSASAQQTNFNKVLNDDAYQFDFAWTDINNEQQNMSFELPLSAVNDKYRHFKALRPSLLKMHSIKKLKQAASQLNPREGKVKIKPTTNGVEFELKSTSRTWLTQTNLELTNVYEKSLSEYLRQEYYIEFESIFSAGSTKIYKPDHKRFAIESAELLQPVVNAIKEKVPNARARDLANFVLGWLQTIPYNTIESRSETNGSGYLPPARVIANNIGDCDSKVTLMAAIMKQIFPRLNIALIYIPEHALIAFHMSHLESDFKIDIDGLSYTLAEPVGPRLIEFSKVSERSKRYIESGNYSVEML